MREAEELNNSENTLPTKLPSDDFEVCLHCFFFFVVVFFLSYIYLIHFMPLYSIVSAIKRRTAD